MKISELQKIIREEVRKVIKEQESYEQVSVSFSFAAKVIGKDEKFNKTYAGPYKLLNKPKAEIDTDTIPLRQPKIKVLTMFQSQIAGSNMDKSSITVTVPHNGDMKKTIEDAIIFVNKTFSKDPTAVQSLLDDSYGAIYQDTNDLKQKIVSVLKTLPTT
jgi:hypothetical protein